jgi:hypothetical protein
MDGRDRGEHDGKRLLAAIAISFALLIAAFVYAVFML